MQQMGSARDTSCGKTSTARSVQMGGGDFKAVLDEIVRIKEPFASVPSLDKGGWPYADVYVGNGWSIAYRTLDAQYWGVPQRRRRIFLVADLAGQCAGKVLFESEGMSGYSAESFRAWQAVARDFENCVGESSGGWIALENHPMDSRIKVKKDNIVESLSARMGTGGMNVPLTLKIRSGCEGGGKGQLIQENLSATLSCNNEQSLFVPDKSLSNTGYTIRKLTPTECARLQGFPDSWCSGLCTDSPTDSEVEYWSSVWETYRLAIGRSSRKKSRSQIIKWLKNPVSDAAQYKMWGNGVALPCAWFVMEGIVWANAQEKSNDDY